MKSNRIRCSIGAIAILMILPQLASAQCGSPANCTIPQVITVCPSADIPTTLIIRDAGNNPCPGQIITMTVTANCLCSTPMTTTAVTNNLGMVTFRPRLGGCCARPGLVTYTDASGVVLGMTNAVNSPDMNGNCLVDLADISLFSSAFFSGYSPCADFNHDGILNLSDIGVLAAHIGH